MPSLSAVSIAVTAIAVALVLVVQTPIFTPPPIDPSLSVLCAASVTHGYNQGNVSDFPGECFFADTYEEARSQFRSLAAECGAETLTLPIGTGGELTTDVAIVRRSKERVIVHVSGTHGVEGFAGSAIQAAALHQLSLQPKETHSDGALPTLVFVHALNPYGMVHNRRVNEENIDLNRNFLSAEQLEMALDRDPNFAHYVDAMDILSPSHVPFPASLDLLNNLRYVLLMSKVLVTGMLGKMKSALLSGNYHFPKGLGFGGQGKSQSFRNLDGFLKGDLLDLYEDGQELSTGLKKFVLVDVHTGLGPSGVDTLSFAGVSKIEKEKFDTALFEQQFPLEMSGSEVIGGIKSTSDQGSEVFAGYELMMGDVKSYYRPKGSANVESSATASRDKVCMTQEFGTYSNTIMGIALVAENHMFHHGSKEQQELYSRKLKQVFYVRSKKWTRAVVHRGMEVLLQAIDFASQ